MANDEQARPLPALRAMIDAVDRDLLQLLARRQGLVAEIASHKRQHGVAIRDIERERLVLRDREERGAALGLPPQHINALFRLLLLASREYQASLRTGLPTDSQSKAIAIIGGEGAMGACMARLFMDLGHAVLVADKGTALSSVEAAKAAELVIISVPIEETEAVIAEVGPHVRPDGLLMDVTSIKSGPVEWMNQHTQATVIGGHPMFGPGVHSFQGHRFVLCPSGESDWLTWLKLNLQARGLLITESTPEEHDRMMALVQVLTHLSSQVVGLTIARHGTPLKETFRFRSPVYLLESYVTARHFSQDARLYGPIEMRNPELSRVLEGFSAAAEEIRNVLESRDLDAFAKIYGEVREYFGDFTLEAREESAYLIDRLVELSTGRLGT